MGVGRESEGHPGGESDALAAAGLRFGQEVRILGGMFVGRVGTVRDSMPSGKIRVEVATLRTLAQASIPPDQLEPVEPGSE
ncbi:MAG: hypothetical protein ACE5HQ_12800 [Gemmatimonadota bacterium]